MLSWQAPADSVVSGYRVSYGPNDDSDDRQTADFEASETAFRHSDSVEGVTYAYTVRSHNARGDSAWTEPVLAVRVNAPETPTGAAAVPQGNSIVFSWAPPVGIVDDYQVRHWEDGQSPGEPTTVPAERTEFHHQDARGDTDYRYQVRARNAAGASPWTAEVTSRWTIPPHAPTDLSVVIDGDHLRAAWNAPASGGVVENYHLEIRTRNHGPWDQRQMPAARTGFDHRDPVPAQEYEYRVRSHNAGGVSAWSSVVVAVWYDAVPPPTNVRKVRIGNLGHILTWQRASHPGITGYEVRHRDDANDWTSVDLSKSSRNHRVNRPPNAEWQEMTVRTLKGDQASEWTPVIHVNYATMGRSASPAHRWRDKTASASTGNR